MFADRFRIYSLPRSILCINNPDLIFFLLLPYVYFSDHLLSQSLNRSCFGLFGLELRFVLFALLFALDCTFLRFLVSVPERFQDGRSKQEDEIRKNMFAHYLFCIPRNTMCDFSQTLTHLGR